MTVSGFRTRITAEKERVYGIRRRFADGTEGYCFVAVDPPREKAFLNAMKGKAVFDIRHFGTVVALGSGEPDEATLAALTARYRIREAA